MSFNARRKATPSEFSSHTKRNPLADKTNDIKPQDKPSLSGSKAHTISRPASTRVFSTPTYGIGLGPPPLGKLASIRASSSRLTPLRDLDFYADPTPDLTGDTDSSTVSHEPLVSPAPTIEREKRSALKNVLNKQTQHGATSTRGHSDGVKRPSSRTSLLAAENAPRSRSRSPTPATVHTTPSPAAESDRSGLCPLTTDLLKPKTHKVTQGQVVVLPSRSLLVDLREGERRKRKRGDEVLVISPDGERVSAQFEFIPDRRVH